MENTTDSHKGLMNQAEAAAFLGVRPRTLEDWRARRVGPKFISYNSRSIRYRPDDLVAFLAARTVSTSDAA